MQYSISGKPANTITNIFVSTPQGAKLTGDQSIVKGSKYFLDMAVMLAMKVEQDYKQIKYQ